MRGLGYLISVLFLVVALLAAPTTPVTAETELDTETYAPFVHSNENPSILFLFGEIDERSGFAFRRALNDHPEISLLALSSPGGFAQMALLISEEVHERKISTMIPEGESCFSSCAFIYFAGYERLVEGQLGVHQISSSQESNQGTQATVSDIIDAMARYGVDSKVLAHMFRTAPDNMYVFEEPEITTLAINRLDVDEAPAQQFPTNAPARINRPETSERDYRQPAVDFVRNMINLHQHSNSQFALGELSRLYAGSVRYFGNDVSIVELMNDKTDYFKRWEQRQYRIRDDSMSVNCVRPDHCTVVGLYDWQVYSPSRNKSVGGTASFEYGISKSQPMRVIIEDGRVINRQ